MSFDKEGPFLLWALLGKKRKKIEVLDLQTLPVKNPEISWQVKRLYKSCSRSSVISALPSKEILLKTFFSPLKNKRALEKVLPFHAQSLSLIPPQEMLFAPLFSSNEMSRGEVSVFLTTKKALDLHLEELRLLGIFPDAISSEAVALVRFAQTFASLPEEALLLHLGKEKGLCVYVEKRTPKAIYPFSQGYSSSFSLKQEIAKVFFSFLREKKLPLLLTGKASSQDLFLPEVLEKISCFLECPPSFKEYALPIGLSVDFLAQDEKSVQFLKNEYTPIHHAKKALKKLLFLFLSSFFLAGLFSLFSFSLLEKERKGFSAEIAKILAKEKNLSPSLALPQGSLKEKLKFLENKIKEEEKSFTFFLPIRKVSEALRLLTFSKELCPSLEIQRFHYELLRFPSPETPEEECLVKIDLEFSCSAPAEARKFHEFLTKQIHFIDAKKEISWENDQQKYKTSFFLQNVKDL